MKKLYLILTLFFFWNASGAKDFYQYEPYSFNRYLDFHVKRDREKVLKQGIASFTEFTNEYREDGTLKRSYMWRKSTFNELGYLVEEIRFSKTGRVEEIITYEYNEKQQVTGRHVKSQSTFGYRTHSWLLEYHNDSLVSRITNKKEGEESWAYRYFYDGNNLLKEQRWYEKGKLTGRIEYDYYPDLSKKEVRYYEDSLDLDLTYRYDCGIGSSLLTEKQKDTMTKCSRNEELPDGTFKTIEEVRDENGRVQRVVYTYNPTVDWSLTEYYNYKNKLTRSYRRDKVAEGVYKTEVTWYGKRKPYYHLVQLESKDTMGFYTWSVLKEDRVVKTFFTTYTFQTAKN